jgi:hypothetical protein
MKIPKAHPNPARLVTLRRNRRQEILTSPSLQSTHTHSSACNRNERPHQQHRTRFGVQPSASACEPFKPAKPPSNRAAASWSARAPRRSGLPPNSTAIHQIRPHRARLNSGEKVGPRCPQRAAAKPAIFNLLSAPYNPTPTEKFAPAVNRTRLQPTRPLPTGHPLPHPT